MTGLVFVSLSFSASSHHFDCLLLDLASAFHSKCDSNTTPTLTIVRVCLLFSLSLFCFLLSFFLLFSPGFDQQGSFHCSFLFLSSHCHVALISSPSLHTPTVHLWWIHRTFLDAHLQLHLRLQGIYLFAGQRLFEASQIELHQHLLFHLYL
jgi:hypothetical protein